MIIVIFSYLTAFLTDKAWQHFLHDYPDVQVEQRMYHHLTLGLFTQAKRHHEVHNLLPSHQYFHMIGMGVSALDELLGTCFVKSYP